MIMIVCIDAISPIRLPDVFSANKRVVNNIIIDWRQADGLRYTIFSVNIEVARGYALASVTLGLKPP